MTTPCDNLSIAYCILLGSKLSRCRFHEMEVIIWIQHYFQEPTKIRRQPNATFSSLFPFVKFDCVSRYGSLFCFDLTMYTSTLFFLITQQDYSNKKYAYPMKHDPNVEILKLSAAPEMHFKSILMFGGSISIFVGQTTLVLSPSIAIPLCMTTSALVLTSCAYGALLIRLIYHPSAWRQVLLHNALILLPI